MQILLETKRLILRRFTELDVDHLFDLDNDPAVMHFINGGTPTPRHIIQTDILPKFLNYNEDLPGCGAWAAIEKATTTFLGWFSFRPEADTPRKVSLGYRLHKATWNKGYATEGSLALIHKGFTELGVQCVLATTYEHNVASRRVMEKLGMTLLRKFRFTAEDLLNANTYHATSLEVWDGYDVEYVLEKAAWEHNLEIEQSPCKGKYLGYL